MKYIICAKNIQDQIYVTDPLKRTEICTELIYTRMRALQLLEQGFITSTDCIVTRKDRFCLYENIFSNLIDYDDYVNLQNPDSINSIDLVSEINNGVIDSGSSYMEISQALPSEVFNISKSDFYAPNPFICILVRGAKNNYEKNISISYWNSLIYELSKGDLDIFVFGETNGINFNLNDDKFMVRGVSGFRGWCSLLESQNCKAVISSCSGGVYPLFFVGNENSKLIIIDNLGLTKKHSDSPSFYHDCINFKNVQKRIFYEIPDPKTIVNAAI